MGVFSEALRQEITARHVRSWLIEPGATASELVAPPAPRGAGAAAARRRRRDPQGEDIADAVVYMVTRPRHMAVNEMLIRPTEQVR